MAEPITWRNVNGPSLADAARPLFYAQQAIQSGTDSLASALKDYQLGQKEIWKQQDADATNALLNRAYTARTADEFAALRDSGDLSNPNAANGARIDLARVNEVLRNRPDELRTAQMNEWKFGREQLMQNEMPLISQVREAFARKDFTGAGKLMEGLSPENRAVVAAEMLKTELEVNKDSRDSRQLDAQIQNWKATAASQATQANASMINAQAHRDQVAFTAQEAAEKNLAALEAQRAALTPGGIGGKDGQKFVEDAITASTKDENTRARLNSAFSAIRANPEFKDAKPADVANALLGDISTGSSFRKFFWDGTGDSAESALRKTMANRSVTSDIATNNTLSSLDQMIERRRQALSYPTAGAATPGQVPGAAKPGTVPGQVPGAAPASPAASATNTPVSQSTTEQRWTPGLMSEYDQQRLEIRNGVRKDFSPAIQDAIKADREDGVKFQEALDKRRIEVSERENIPVPKKPDLYNQTYSVTPGMGAIKRNEQVAYQRWVQAIDARIAREEAAKKNR